MNRQVYAILMLLAMTLATQLTRQLASVLWKNRTPPRLILYLGAYMGPAIIALLVVYCLKGINVLAYPYGIPEAVCVALVTTLHKWKHNSALSILGGTAAYMALVQLVFV